MFVELKVMGEPNGGRRVVAPFGQAIKVGRLERGNELTVPDRLLAPVHFELAWDGAAYRATDLSKGVQKHPACQQACFQEALRAEACRGICRIHDRSQACGLYLNGTKIDSAVVTNGDVLVAGSSCFVLTLADTPPAAPGPPPAALPEKLALTPEQRERALAFFASQKLPLYALLDAARDPGVLDTIAVHEAVYYSLYDGPEGERLEEVAPYLVEVRSRSPLLEALVRAWGKSWGSFVYALADFKTVRRHFRRFLLVQDERGKNMYFRFYDPRVLGPFLSSCTPSEALEFFGPLSHFVVESEEQGNAWAYQRDEAGQLAISRIPF
ncbi:MAG TPA: DUF4123 domain-containing protein [Polyangiaceae bacterium]|nr:DUF4123 domain-containing protein [Polyangiaceae bacterium]